MNYAIYISEQDYVDFKKLLPLLGKIIYSVDQSKQEEELYSRFDKVINEGINGGEAYAPPPLDKDENRLLIKFSEKELIQMPKRIRIVIRELGYAVYARKRTSGRYNCSYEIRFKRNGYDISASGTTKEEAKQRFIKKAKLADEKKEDAVPAIPKDFHGFALFWFENFYKRKVCSDYYKKNLDRYYKYLKPLWGEIRIKDVTSTAIQKLLDELSDRHRLEEDVHSMLNQLFNCAVKHGLINLNPVGMVFHQNKERKHGIAISKKNEKKLLNFYSGTVVQTVIAVMLYTGLRPCEYSSAIIEEKFIKARNRKRRGGIIEYKRIAISPMLRPYIDGLTELPRMSMQTLDRRIKAVLPEHKPYDMRTTFETRCDECKIDDRVIGLFMGNGIGKGKNSEDAKLKKAYTDTNDEDYLDYLFREGQKLNY